jgi:hypothetical protein
MPATYEPIATTTLGSAAASISFSSIPSTYTDLRVVIIGRNATSSSVWRFRLNSDTASNYSYTYISGNGTTASSNYNAPVSSIDYCGINVNVGTTQPVLATIDIFSYAGSTNKTCLFTSNNDLNGSGVVERGVGLWRSTSAINTILLYRGGADNLAAGTTATLYGILKA